MKPDTSMQAFTKSFASSITVLSSAQAVAAAAQRRCKCPQEREARLSASPTSESSWKLIVAPPHRPPVRCITAVLGAGALAAGKGSNPRTEVDGGDDALDNGVH